MRVTFDTERHGEVTVRAFWDCDHWSIESATNCDGEVDLSQSEEFAAIDALASVREEMAA